jgi:predicted MFS family arabinose efflux permease
VVTDALALDILPQHERGRANGVMSAAKYLGMLAGGSGLAWLATRTGWPATYVVAAAMLLVPAAVVLPLREPPAERRPPFGLALHKLWRETMRSLLRRATPLAFLFVLVSGAGDSFLYPFITNLLRRRLALPADTVALLIGLAAVASAGGALLGGLISDTLGRRRTIVLGAVALALSHLGFAALAPSWPVLLGYELTSGVAGGILYAALIALCMDLTNPRLPATHFQLLMALLNLRSAWASRAGGHLAEAATGRTVLGVAALIELAPLVLLLWIDPRREAESFRSEDRSSRA